MDGRIVPISEYFVFISRFDGAVRNSAPFEERYSFKERISVEGFCARHESEYYDDDECYEEYDSYDAQDEIHARYLRSTQARSPPNLI